MATWVGKELDPEFLNALQEWRNNCLLKDGSLFTDKPLWTKDNFIILEKLLVEKPNNRNDDFYDFLHIRLKGYQNNVIQLASEIIWLLLLIVEKRQIGLELKRSRVVDLWNLSEENFPVPDTEKLNEVIYGGFINPGPNFKGNLWPEYVLLVQILKKWKDLNSNEYSRLLFNNPLGLCKKIDDFTNGQDRAVRHIFLYYCYPSYFEKISSKDHKRFIYDAFSHLLEETNNPYKQNESPCGRDHAIHEIRQHLEKICETNKLDFHADMICKGEKINLRYIWDHKWKKKHKNEISKTTNDLFKSTTEDSKDDHPLNQILYGPPGTGKTWGAVNHAIAIIDDCTIKELEGYKREDIVKRLNELKEGKQVGMVTFHQSFTYEDFVEGIKPNLDPTEERFDFVLEDGIFKIICDKAKEYRNVQGPKFDINLLLDAFAGHVQEKLEDEKFLVHEKGSDRFTIDNILYYKEGYFRSFQIYSGKYPISYTRNVIKRDYHDFYEGKSKSPKDIRPPHNHRKFKLYEKIKEYHENEWEGQEDVGPKKFVLIVDEINRGNISKIFGELITLIEDTKRLGKSDETSVILPYSKEQFCIPDNVYIIGTMNTADRSIALLDTALRRRFEFVEMMPDPFHKDISKNIDGIDLQKLLAIMNKRIVVLLNREHQIGHTYFLKIESIEELNKTFQNKIIPLLQEYFYDDWAKINLVLNDNGFVESDETSSARLKDDGDGLVDKEKKIYKLLPKNNPNWEKSKKYKQIYKSVNDETEDKVD